ncbi:MAG: NADH-dependent [FeFe] hydrogenase, group A6 [Clostridium sp.]|nr:NADH-dependent [FeFe] hydrogenase, group A6 [Clostridium sp.]MDY6081832.1 NADH-dependent [FeFe] hydrogenase, group A6 [Eubacteriales bacterium]
MENVHVKINGIEVEVPANYTILQAAHEAGIRIPTLCYLKDINAIAACRICLVEATGVRGLAAACVQQVADGMEVKTNTPELRKSRKTTLELMLSNHRMDCLSCVRSDDCELRRLAHEYGVDQYKYVGNEELPKAEEAAAGAVDSPRILRDNSKCILCRRCIAVCQKNQHVAVIGANDRGFETHVASAFDMPLTETPCVNCGQCVAVCPTGALRERDDTDKVWEALQDQTKTVVIAPAPSVRAQIGECFEYPIGTNVEGKLVAAMRRLGFDKVFDVDTAADLTIMEEGTELLDRLKNGGALPLLTSCSPGWIKFCEEYYPDMIPNISSCKSPQGMYGAMMKTYYAEKNGIDPKDLFVVSVMPCTAKKFEIGRDDMSAAGEGIPDIDVSLTTRELAAMIKRAGIRFRDLPDEQFDPAFGIASGAGHIFGATGGVMEAALRTVAEIVTGKPMENVEFHEVRGLKDIREAEYDLAGTKVRVAVTSGLENAKKLLDMVKSGEKQYHFIEVMACPGGCVNGGGQPHQSGDVRNFTDLRAERAKALYSEDAGMSLRKSHENPVVKELYETYLEKPGSHKAHEILHTSYVARKVY